MNGRRRSQTDITAAYQVSGHLSDGLYVPSSNRRLVQLPGPVYTASIHPASQPAETSCFPVGYHQKNTSNAAKAAAAAVTGNPVTRREGIMD